MSFPDRGLFVTIEAKTADYQVKTEDIGKILTNRGASGAVTFTLPAVTSPTLPAGWWVEFFVVAGQNVTIASSGSLDNLVAFNDATADSIAFSTATELIGNGVRVVWDGTSWLVFVALGAETATPTIA